MWRCEDVKMWRCGCEDVKMCRCEDMRMWRCEDVKMWGCEDVKMWWCEDVKMWRCEDVKLWRCKDVMMWRCESMQIQLLEEPFAQTLSGKNGLQDPLQFFSPWIYEQMGPSIFKSSASHGGSCRFACLGMYRMCWNGPLHIFARVCRVGTCGAPVVEPSLVNWWGKSTSNAAW